VRLLSVLLALFATAVAAATGEAVYKSKCNACHDSGAGNAPRVHVREDWRERETRGRAAMHASALKGVPYTAMAAKGGYAELTDTEVRDAVEYMMVRVGFRDVVPAKPAVIPPVPLGISASFPDATLLEQVALALQRAFAPRARIEVYDGQATVREVNIRVAVREGVVTLSGAVEKGDIIPRAQAVAQAVTGVRVVVSRLVAAGMLDFD
jgi:cytochrome c5